MSLIVCGALALLVVIQTANGLNCYSCNPQNSINCAWGITPFTYPTETCSSDGELDSHNGPKCYKITGESKDGREFIARGCAPPEAAIACAPLVRALGSISSQSSNEGARWAWINCDTCDTDKCNSAQKITGITFVTLILAAAAFIV